MSYHNLILEFVPVRLTSYDQLNFCTVEDVNTIDELSDLIYKESNEWFGNDNVHSYKEALIQSYNLWVFDRENLNGSSVGIEQHGVRAYWSELNNEDTDHLATYRLKR